MITFFLLDTVKPDLITTSNKRPLALSDHLKKCPKDSIYHLQLYFVSPFKIGMEAFFLYVTINFVIIHENIFMTLHIRNRLEPTELLLISLSFISGKLIGTCDMKFPNRARTLKKWELCSPISFGLP